MPVNSSCRRTDTHMQAASILPSCIRLLFAFSLCQVACSLCRTLYAWLCSSFLFWGSCCRLCWLGRACLLGGAASAMKCLHRLQQTCVGNTLYTHFVNTRYGVHICMVGSSSTQQSTTDAAVCSLQCKLQSGPCTSIEGCSRACWL